uniref:FERM domain-containing protein 8 n=1 Tax=Strigamia maritima TaxID=126957 RepID=T1J5Z1_STRMM
MAKYSDANEFGMKKLDIRLKPTFKERLHFAGTSAEYSSLEICVYLKNKVGVTLELENGQIATADELVHLIFNESEVGLTSSEAHKIFSLWFSSSLLEVQLKPFHLPYKILQQWPQLLQKYTTCDKSDLELDEPILSLQRNVFYSIKEEEKLDDCNILNLLYEEAKCNILEARYPCEEGDYYKLASLQAGIELGPFNPNLHTLSFFRSKVNGFLPHHLCKPRWLLKLNFNAKSGPDSHILEQYCNIPLSTTADQLKKKYLHFCWALPYYGSAFFHGQIEKPKTMLSNIFGTQDKEVLIAINSEGIYIINEDENTLLLGLKYHEFSWAFIKSSQPCNPDCFPSLYIQFQVQEAEAKVWKMLQLFSKQAIMMNAIISSFVEDLKASNNWENTSEMRQNISLDVDEVDIGTGSDLLSDTLVPLTKTVAKRSNSSASCISNKLYRLSLTTFNEDGDCISSTGS